MPVRFPSFSEESHHYCIKKVSQKNKESAGQWSNTELGCNEEDHEQGKKSPVAG